MIALWLAGTVAHAGPWVRDPGGVYAKGEASVFAGLADQSAQTMHMDGQEDMTYRDVRATAYAEVGLPGSIQVTAYVPYIAAWNSSPGAQLVNIGGGDAELGLTRKLHRTAPIAAEVRGRAPTYRDRSEERLERFGMFGDGFPDPGDGSIAVDGLIHAGGGWKAGAASGWVQGTAGYRHRFGDFVDAAVFDAVAGWTPSFGWLGVGVGGTVNLAEDERARDGVAGRVFGAGKVTEALAVEANTSWTPSANMSSPGVSAGVGLSLTR